MPAWISITAAHLEDARVAELVAALREEALGETQTDPLPRFIQTVVDEIRSCIGFCASTPLDVDPAKIPANLKDLAVQKIVRAMKGRLLQPLSDDEKADEKTYQARLLLLTECAWPVDRTDTPIGTTSVASPVIAPLISAPERRYGRDAQDGT